MPVVSNVTTPDNSTADVTAHLRGLPRTEHPPQPAGGGLTEAPNHRGSASGHNASAITDQLVAEPHVAAAPPAAHDAQDSRWLQDSADSVAWAAHSMPESPHEISRDPTASQPPMLRAWVGGPARRGHAHAASDCIGGCER
eukprot:jgi/Chrpa1/25831/Chrysochromulina_OHIO_Genome00026114-RA